MAHSDRPEVTPPNKLRRADLVVEDGKEDLNFLLPPPQVIGPDVNGIKKVIEYKFNEHGEKIRVTTTTRIRKILRSKAAAERRLWPKFGDAANEDETSRLTMVSKEEVFLQRPKAEGNEAEKTEGLGESLALHGNRGGALLICSICGKKSKHWTSRCPYRDLASKLELDYNDRPSSEDASAASSSISSKKHYVPPSKRAGAKRSSGEDMKHRKNENSVRFKSLSEDTSEADLYDLCSPFGALTRVFVATDSETGLCSGFGYVHFVKKEDGQKAIDKLNGYGYDNRILQVKWADKTKN